MAKRRRIALGAGLLTAVVALAIALSLALTTDGATRGRPHDPKDPRTQAQTPRNALALTIGPPPKVHPIRPGFLGLSIEYPSIEPYAGTDPGAINPTLINLIRNITPNQSPVIRIGGDRSDWEWWPVPGMTRPGGVKYTLTPTWLAVTKALAQELNAKLILGLDLEANSLKLASTEAAHFVDGIGKSSIEAFEPGNEPELYGSWPWYVAPGHRAVHGRAASWSIGDYARQVIALRRQLDPSARSVPLAGPATGGATWLSELPQFLPRARYLSLLTIHHYPVQSCYTPPSSPKFPSIANLLNPRASRGLAAIAKPSIALAHARGIPARVDEINTNSCGSAPNVTKSFASALWATDALFAMAAAGADGVNVHTYKKSSYELFQFAQTGNTWRTHVEPEYYGLYLFALAAPPGSQLLDLHGPATRQLSTWATKAPDGHLRITLINDDQTHSRTVAIAAPGETKTPATLINLNAPSASARTGTRIAGQIIRRRGGALRPPANTDRSPHQRPLRDPRPRR